MANWSWWSFVAGIVTAFLVSTGALLGWWLILIRTTKKTGPQLVRDYERARKEILN